ncbi:hypothetical protein [Fimbriiglobus ruber]|uniref:Metallopeptidase n=1 Tax=Fimbriiglobus ruber TaxID=1908690 RepID=A0A225DFR6_9BACT|nr:hypothetical protein [Fimbriiglobus ruber]OWK40332.1 hypothetical protein FRUB_05251 [Fimbriiglobus ruber]
MSLYPEFRTRVRFFTGAWAVLVVCGVAHSQGSARDAKNAAPKVTRPVPGYESRQIVGWDVYVSEKLLADQKEATVRALDLLRAQLETITKLVPEGPLERIRGVPLWFNPEYPGVPARAEYHPGAGWLRANHRNPAMVKGVEFTNVGIFEPEVKRMPLFVLHELAHAYHDLVLGFDHPKIEAAYARAVESKSYEAVRRHNGKIERAYAITNAREYFAESTEAFFGRNDFYPFDRAELKKHDPDMEALVGELWKVKSR